MEKETKMTKKEYYEELKEILINSDVEDKEVLIDFVENQINVLNAQSEKAKIRAAEKKAAGDELRAIVKSVLTEELQTAEEITAQIKGEDISKSKVIARLTQLVNNEEAVKEEVKTEDGKKRMAYKMA